MKYALLVLMALPLCSQTLLPDPVRPPIQEYLQLTNAQTLAIAANNRAYNEAIYEKTQRIWQVQLEITDETKKDPLDPAALGVRYAEIELICRDQRDLAIKNQNANLALLTDAQKTKMNVLEEAMKLAPLVAGAQGLNLLSAATSSTNSISVFSLTVGGFIGLGTTTGCSDPGYSVRRLALSHRSETRSSVGSAQQYQGSFK